MRSGCPSSCWVGSTDWTRSKHALSEGFSFVAMARALLREPDLVGRWEKGVAVEGLCIHCNKCMPTIYTGTRCVLVPADEVI